MAHSRTSVSIAPAIVTVAALALPSACTARRPVANDRGIPPCAAPAADNLLSADALQCWFQAPHGRWRVLSHESHYEVLVVQIAAVDTRDADTIARWFVERQRGSWSEILIYVQPDDARRANDVERIRWTREGGFERRRRV